MEYIAPGRTVLLISVPVRYKIDLIGPDGYVENIRGGQKKR